LNISSTGWLPKAVFHINATMATLRVEVPMLINIEDKGAKYPIDKQPIAIMKPPNKLKTK